LPKNGISLNSKLTRSVDRILVLIREMLMKTPGHSVPIRNWSREILITWGLLAFTLVAVGFLCVELIEVLARSVAAGQWWAAAEQSAFIAAVGSFLYGGVVYQVSRLGFLVRARDHERATDAELGSLRALLADAPPVAVLVPAYREEWSVVRQTLLSAALQDYPNRRVVLLIDDPPHPSEIDRQHELQRMRDLPGEIAAGLDKPNRILSSALDGYLQRRSGPLDRGSETLLLASLHADAARWLEARAAEEPQHSATDRLFVEIVFHASAVQHRERSDELAERFESEMPLDEAEILREFQRLAARFRVEMGAFERKRYENLAWKPNKAMNLNAYIGLLGGRYRDVRAGSALRLERCAGEPLDLDVPHADYLVTLDADSLIVHDYTLRLVEIMERPENDRLAVAQTPYSAVPGTTGAVERIAGATTDIQYIVHQGFTRHGATYWVGANALIRSAALQDICTHREERGFEVPVFIQDRTAIEDTESSIDLVVRGWSLHNEPERLAFSATPPDFGALTIQRRRWANGGLVILPKLVRHALSRRPDWPRSSEFFLRCHYLTSIALVNFSLVLLLVVPFENAMRSAWLPVASIAYFALYARDLVQEGYRKGDVLRAYALNLVLVPVNLAGVGQSIWQLITGCRSRFARTPKVANRTRVGAGILSAVAALLGLCVWRVASDLQQGLWFHAAFLFVNGGLLAYGSLRFIGARAFVADLASDVRAHWNVSVNALRGIVVPASPVGESVTER
jgi:cellulose synthase/poly-beta-1,6-N-acetylglucosamine synthase-like glycosyltransferase